MRFNRRTRDADTRPRRHHVQSDWRVDSHCGAPPREARSSHPVARKRSVSTRTPASPTSRESRPPPAFPRNARIAHHAGGPQRPRGPLLKLTPPGENLPDPDPAFATPGWPTPAPPFETVRQSTLGYIEASHAQVAINSHFFAPFPVPFPATNTQGAYAYLIGLAASRGNVYSAFEAPFQNYALVTDSPAINIDPSNNASVVHRDPAFEDGKHVLEGVHALECPGGIGADRHRRGQDDSDLHRRHPSRWPAHSSRAGQLLEQQLLVRAHQCAHGRRSDPGQPHPRAVHRRYPAERPRSCRRTGAWACG